MNKQTRTATGTIRRALRGNRGSIQDVIFLALVGTLIAAASTRVLPGAAAVLTATGLQAERQAAIDALVSDKRNDTDWGTAAAPTTIPLTVPSGKSVNAAVWATSDTTGITYFAAAPKERTPKPGACTGPSAGIDDTCLHAQLFRAYDATTLIPAPIVRKDPSAPTAIGTVNTSVATTSPIPTDSSVLSQVAPATPRAWRYLLNAASVGAGGELRFIQDGTVLATIPLDNTASNYFGTIPARPGGGIWLQVSDGPVLVKTVLIYDAGVIS
ncbi:hypothetical protein [uncultured Leifsonia sp.]|uniref:hypothetical protein n=1 Tax=uncultured Leifsonia sp. TaxID=340359 RepID=UPI0025EC3D15|nr:hypothetical protein [uncultured Leifsonia sp.]